jgi:sugar O-acyltransferase (sialic acid O-acetyltransferase NeuD family)
MKKLIIIGASGFGREIAWLAERINEKYAEWDIIGFLDDKEELKDAVIGGYKVLGKVQTANNYHDAYFVCAIGSASVRKKVITKINEMIPNAKYATLIDPTVQMSKRVEIGEGSMICAGNIITVDIKIGKHVIMNLDCTVGHDAVIGDFTTFYPSVNLSGITTVGECTELGTGSHIIQGINIGHNSIVGAGAVVIKDIPDKCTAVGAPAKPIKFFE